MAADPLARKQKIHPRGKTRLWRRHKIFVLLRYGVFLIFLSWAAIAAAQKLRQFNPMPVSEFSVIPKPLSVNHLWVEAVNRDLKNSWTKKSRFFCLLAAPRLTARLERNYPFIRKSSVSYLSILFKGEVRLGVVFRSPVAVSEDSGACLDEEGVFFPCPAGEPVDDLIRARRLAGLELAQIIKVTPKIESVLGEKVAYAERISDAVIALKTRSAKTVKLVIVNARHLKTFEQSLEKLVTIKKDLDARQETWQYLDMTFIDEGRIIVGA